MLNLAPSWLLALQDASETPSGSLISFLLPLLIIGGLFYFLLIMPQRRRMKSVNEMRSAVQVGDEVRTIGGIYGIVRSMDDEEVVLDVGGGTTLRVVKRAVAERLNIEG